MIAVFDTNIVIDALNGLPEADEEYGRYDRVLISDVTWLEILSGADGDDELLRDFLEAHFQIIPLDLAIADEALRLRREFRLHLPDAIIWARRDITMPRWSRATPRISIRNGKEFICRIRFNSRKIN